MACECKNEDGSLTDQCFGTCLPAKRIQATILSGEVRLEIITNKINKILSLLEEINTCEYKEAFKDGFQMAREIYE